MTDINILSSILLVDDDSTSIFLQEHLLVEGCNYKGNIQACVNGKAALDYIENKGEYVSNGNSYPKPELILLDINMPVMNGFEFLEAYTKLPEEIKGGIIISMLTSSLNKLDKEKADQFKDVSAFITKPLEKEALMAIVKENFG